MTKILNFSRHPFNADQKTILKENGFDFSDEVLAPFFKDGQDFLTQVDGTTASVVVPSHILLEAISEPKNSEIFSFSILSWEADAEARKRGNFAVRGLKKTRITRFKNTERGGTDLVIFTKTLSANFKPTEENSFSTGEAKPYGG
jgi:hypothetical protein